MEQEQKAAAAKSSQDGPPASGKTKAADDLEKIKQSFTGDFERLDVEIKCQVKAIINKDYDVLERI